MDFNATIDLIIKDLDEAREIIDDLKKYPGVPALQVELAKSKCKSAGEVIALLKNLKEITHIATEEPVRKKKQQQIPEEEKVPVRPVEIPKPVTQKHEEPEKTIMKSVESSIIADKFSHLQGSLNEQLGSLKGDDDFLKSQPIVSLTDAIGVNDKFLFIREIFNGKSEDYLQAISRLENSESIADARAVIMSYTGDNTENEAVKQLLDLVKRKRPSNE